MDEENNRWTEYVLVIAIGIFAILRLIFSFPRFSDGNIYLYLSSLVAQGLAPYRDFFYSSPPLIPYLYALFGGLFGFTWQAFNLIPLLLTVADAILIYLIIRHRYSSLAGLISAVSYLFSFSVLATTDFVSDIHVVLTLILAGVFSSEKNKQRLAGFFFALAGLAKLYALVIVAAWLANLAWSRRWSELKSFIFFFALFFGGGLIVSWLAFGENFVTYVISSHLGKISGLSKIHIISFYARHDWFLVAAPLAGISLSLLPSPHKERGDYRHSIIPSFIVLPIAFMLVFLLFFQDVYFLYFKILTAFLALWWGWNFYHLSRAFLTSDVNGKTSDVVPVRRSKLAASTILIIILLAVPTLSIWRYISEQANAAIIPLNEVTDYVRSHTSPNEVIFGSFEFAPLVSLAAERTIWHNLADTNIKFIMTGLFDLETRAKDISRDKVRLILTKALVDQSGRIIAGPEQVLSQVFFSTHCRVGKIFPIERDYSHNAVVAWLCF